MPQRPGPLVKNQPPLALTSHPEYAIDFRTCAECGETKSAIEFDVIVPGPKATRKRGRPVGAYTGIHLRGDRLADTCLDCERKAAM